MRRLSVALCLSVMALLTVSSGHPVHAAAPAVADIAPLQAWQADTKANVNYIGSRHGLDVWIATRDSKLQLIYTTADKQGMLVDGNLIGPGNTDVTAELQRDFVARDPQAAEAMLQTVNGSAAAPTPTAAVAPVPAPPARPGKSELLWRDLTQAQTVSFGNPDAPLAYMIVDLACDHCKLLWNQLQPAIDANALHVRLLPVGILGKASETKAASLLSQPDPAAAWLVHARNGKEATNVTPAGKAAFAVNQAIPLAYKLNSTPILIYRDQARHTVKMVLGNPNDIATVWHDLGVIPARPAPEPVAAP